MDVSEAYFCKKQCMDVSEAYFVNNIDVKKRKTNKNKQKTNIH